MGGWRRRRPSTYSGLPAKISRCRRSCGYTSPRHCSILLLADPCKARWRASDAQQASIRKSRGGATMRVSEAFWDQLVAAYEIAESETDAAEAAERRTAPTNDQMPRPDYDPDVKSPEEEAWDRAFAA